MRTTTKILSAIAVMMMFNATLLLALAQTSAEKKVRIHVNTEINDEIGMTAEDIEKATQWYFGNLGIETADESGDGVIELYVKVGQDDADDDNDGVNDAQDADDDGNEIADQQEAEFEVNLDQAGTEVLDEFPDKDKERGVYVILYTGGKKDEQIRAVSTIDSFETENASFNPVQFFFRNAGFSPIPQQTPTPTPKPKTTPTPAPTPKVGRFPTTVNDQIADSVKKANTKVLGDAPAIAMGNLYQATAQALANAAHNATNTQQQSFVSMQAATTRGVATIYSLDTAATGISTLMILR